MSTLPRSFKSSNFDPLDPHVFDAGINTSAAWQQHLDQVSDIPTSPVSDVLKSARVLYDFDGKHEYRELSARSGENIQVIQEDLAEGWSLVRTALGFDGLLPRSYWTYTADFVQTLLSNHTKDGSNDTVIPGKDTGHITSQHTGDWALPNIRQSLLRGRSLNRFGHFVTSGAEEWILNGASAEPTHASAHTRDSSTDLDDFSPNNRADPIRHFVDGSHRWRSKVSPFRVLVHSPSTLSHHVTPSYTVYNVTTLFSPKFSCENLDLDQHIVEDTNEDVTYTPTEITVFRRFSHFLILRNILSRQLPGIAIPPLPEKQYSGRFSDEFVEARRGDLERFLSRLVRHPIVRYADFMTFFLTCENESEWDRYLPVYAALNPAGASFFANVLHPDFNVDVDDAVEVADFFENHLKAVGSAVQRLRADFVEVREARIGMAKAERLLSYSLLALIAPKRLHTSGLPPDDGDQEDDSHQGATIHQIKGISNNEGAWCWRDGCSDCLRLTKAIQKTCETLQNVADLYDNQGRRRQLSIHETLKFVAHPLPMYDGVLSLQRAAANFSKNSVGTDAELNETTSTRCETVLNTTMAEIETYHSQKCEDFSTIMKDHLDAEIELHEKVLSRMRAARDTFEDSQFKSLSNSPRQQSLYERTNISVPVSNPLPMPAAHVHDLTPMRPVSLAVQEGFGMLLGASRSSIFDNFWPKT